MRGEANGGRTVERGGDGDGERWWSVVSRHAGVVSECLDRPDDVRGLSGRKGHIRNGQNGWLQRSCLRQSAAIHSPRCKQGAYGGQTGIQRNRTDKGRRREIRRNQCRGYAAGTGRREMRGYQKRKIRPTVSDVRAKLEQLNAHFATKTILCRACLGIRSTASPSN